MLLPALRIRVEISRAGSAKTLRESEVPQPLLAVEARQDAAEGEAMTDTIAEVRQRSQQAESLMLRAGLRYMGLQSGSEAGEAYAMAQDPETRSTIALPLEGLTLERICDARDSSRAKFAKDNSDAR